MNTITPTEINNLFNIFSYYKDVDSDCDYINILNDELSKYKSFIREYIDAKFGFNISYEVKQNCNKIINSITCYYNGDIDSAIQKISDIINSKYITGIRYLKSSLDVSLSGISISDLIILSNPVPNKPIKHQKHFFKARVFEAPYFHLTEDKIFHIPFHKRDLIANQRYSINGLPCLYLGNTALVCWEELNRPNFENFYMSHFEIVNQSGIDILDLSYGFFEISTILEAMVTGKQMKFPSIEAALKELLIMWPLVASSRYSVKSKNRSFKSEYIIPQLIMQSILKLNINGVAYISTRIPRNIYSTLKTNFEPKILYTNYAFPAIKNNSDTYFSGKLRNNFKLTPVFNLGSFEHMDAGQKHSTRQIEYENYRAHMSLFGIQTYNNSIFNKFENRLCCYPAETIADSYIE